MIRAIITQVEGRRGGSSSWLNPLKINRFNLNKFQDAFESAVGQRQQKEMLVDFCLAEPSGFCSGTKCKYICLPLWNTENATGMRRPPNRGREYPWAYVLFIPSETIQATQSHVAWEGELWKCSTAAEPVLCHRELRRKEGGRWQRWRRGVKMNNS